MKRAHAQSVCTLVLLCGGWSGPVCGLSGSRLRGESTSLRHFRLQSHTQPLMSVEQSNRGPINKACLIQPQPSSLPSFLCLREDTTACAQTAVYPALLAVVRGIIHMLLCQQRKRETNKEMPWKINEVAHKATSLASMWSPMWISVILSVPVLLTAAWGCCATRRWFGRDVSPERLHMILINPGLPHRCLGDTVGLDLQILAKHTQGERQHQ